MCKQRENFLMKIFQPKGVMWGFVFGLGWVFLRGLEGGRKSILSLMRL